MHRYPIIILHGWNLAAVKLAPLQKEFETRGFSVSCFDLPGFGYTASLNRAYTIEDYATYIVNHLEKQKIKEAIVIGHSFGGRIGIYLSTHYPLLVKALVVCGTPALGANLTPKERIYLFLAKAGNGIFFIWPLSHIQDTARKILYKLAGSYDYYKTSGLLRETFKNIVNYRLEPFLGKIAAPTLLIWGEGDKIVPVKVAYGMHELIQNSKLAIIKDARHAVPWTHSSEFADEVEKFLNSLK